MRKFVLSIIAVLFVSLQVYGQRKQVTGTVTSEDGQALAGVTVVYGDASAGIGAITGLDGKYSVNVPNEGTLIFSYIGYEAVEVPIGGKTQINVTLLPSSTEIEGVMVVAYGTTTKEAFTGSAGVLDKAELSKRQVSNVTKALSGTVAGVQAFSTSGQPGTKANVRIRGVGSMSSDNSPLYVVDGVPYDGDISAINSSDIESMNVLKDASAAAIYGARGANGVILINTKRGMARDAEITVESRWGSNSRGVPQYSVLKSTDQYFETLYSAMYNSATMSNGLPHYQAHVKANNGLFGKDGGTGYKIYSIPNGQYLIGHNGKVNPDAKLGWSDGEFYYTPDNWYDEAFKGSSFRQEYNVSISGATDKNNYYFSAGYMDDSGYIPNSALERFTTRFKTDMNVRKWLKVSANMAFTNSDSNYPDGQSTDDQTSSANLFYIGNVIAPAYPMYVRDADTQNVIIDERGFPIYDFGDGRQSNQTREFLAQSNPLAVLALNHRTYKADIFSGRWSAVADVYDGLKLSANIGYDIDNTTYTNKYNKYYGQYASSGGYIYKVRYKTASTNQQYLATYKKRFDKHNLDLLLGYESYELNDGYLQGNRLNIYNNDNNELNNAIGDPNAYSKTDYYSTRGVLTRVQYDYNGKYFLSASYRRDASSRFHPDSRWGNFGSVGGAWIISQEDFMSNAGAVDLLKLKASWGVQGNDKILYPGSPYANYYPYQDQYQLTDSGGDFATTLKYKGNKDITWETSYNFNVGVEFGLFGNRLSGSVEYFNRKTEDLLYNKPAPLSAGYSTVPVNFGSIRNSGVELDLHGTLLRTNNLEWNMFFNGTYLKNKILKLPEEMIVDGSRVFIKGKSLYNMYLREWAGVDANTGEGLYYMVKDNEYVLDAAGNRTTTTDWSATERMATGNIMPTFYGGFGTTLSFYGFDLSASFAFQLGGKVYDDTYATIMHGGSNGDSGVNWHKDISKAWTPDNRYTNVPRMNSSDEYNSGNYRSTRFLFCSDFLSINNITFGYTIPEKYTNKLKIKSVRIYFAGDNLGLLAHRKGMDPRQVLAGLTGSYSYAAIRTLSGGVSFKF